MTSKRRIPIPRTAPGVPYHAQVPESRQRRQDEHLGDLAAKTLAEIQLADAKLLKEHITCHIMPHVQIPSLLGLAPCTDFCGLPIRSGD